MSDMSLIAPSELGEGIPEVFGNQISPLDASAHMLRGLHYPMGRWSPEPGTLKELAEGIFWLRMPLPMSLNHINLYVLDDGEGWALIDTGLNTDVTKAHWETIVAGPLAGKPISRVICTHYHPDHLGLAGWLCARFGVELWIARTEYLLAQSLLLDVADTVPDEIVEFYRAAGWTQEALDVFRGRGWGNFGRAVSALPRGYRRIKDGDVIRIGKRDWRIVVGRGHAPEHTCLVCDEAKVMISGDQVLPRITSNVSVYPSEPHADPLGDWMESLDMLETLDPDLFVLPAHNEPFYGLHVRAHQLRDDHLSKLARLHEICGQKTLTTMDSFEVLFKRAIHSSEMMMATGEAMAHFHYLKARGQVDEFNVKGVKQFNAK